MLLHLSGVRPTDVFSNADGALAIGSPAARQIFMTTKVRSTFVVMNTHDHKMNELPLPKIVMTGDC
jgi:hypothetical protein